VSEGMYYANETRMQDWDEAVKSLEWDAVECKG